MRTRLSLLSAAVAACLLAASGCDLTADSDEDLSIDPTACAGKCDQISLLGRGDFAGAGDRVLSGEAILFDYAGYTLLYLSKDFETPPGPDLFVFLSPTESVEADAVKIAALESFTGAQLYLVPDGVTTESHPYVIIYCVPFSVVFGYADLLGLAEPEQPAEARGEFTGAGDRVLHGEALLSDAGGAMQLSFSEDFETPSGPGLYVYLSPTATITADSVQLGSLVSPTGAQSYAVPEGVTAESHPYVIIYCVPFSVLFGYAELAVL
jgi:hypothetical protein